jgi:hypothetical protein
MRKLLCAALCTALVVTLTPAAYGDGADACQNLAGGGVLTSSLNGTSRGALPPSTDSTASSPASPEGEDLSSDLLSVGGDGGVVASATASTANHIVVSDTSTTSGACWKFLTEEEWQLTQSGGYTPPEPDDFNTLGRGYFIIEDGAELTISGVTHENTVYIASGAAVKLTFENTEITWAEPAYTFTGAVDYETKTGISNGVPLPAGCLHVGTNAVATFAAIQGATVTLESENSDLRQGVIRMDSNASLDFIGKGTWNISGYAVNSQYSAYAGALIGSQDMGARFHELNFYSGTFNLLMKSDQNDRFSQAHALIGDGGRSGGFERLYFGDCEVRCTYYYNSTNRFNQYPFFVGMSNLSSNRGVNNPIIFDGTTFIGRVVKAPNTAHPAYCHTMSTIGKSYNCSAGASVLIKGDSVIDIDGGIGNSSNTVVAWNEYEPITVDIEGGLVMCRGSEAPGIGADYLTISGEDTRVYATTEASGDNPPPAIGGWVKTADAEVDIKIKDGASVMAMTAGSGVAIGGASTKVEGINIDISGDDTTVIAVATGNGSAIGSGITAGYTVLNYDNVDKPLIMASSIRAMDKSGSPKEFDAADYAYIYDSYDVRLGASIIDLTSYPSDTSGLERVLSGDIYLLKDMSIGSGIELRIPKYWNLHKMEHAVGGAGTITISGKQTKLTTVPPTNNFTNYTFPTTVYGHSPGTARIDTATVVPENETLSFEWYKDDDGDPFSGTQTSTGVKTKSFEIPDDLSVGTHYYYARVRGSSAVPRVVDLSTPCFVVKVTGASPKVTQSPVGLTAGYTGEAVPLLQAGEVEGGTLLYSLGDPGGPFSEDVPTATAKGTYWVYYKVQGDANHIDDTKMRALSAEIVDLAFSTPETLPAGTVNNPYTGVTIKGSGLGNLAVELISDNLPADMEYDVTTGALTGTPRRSGTYLLSLRVSTDNAGVDPVEGNFRLKIDPLTFSFYGNGGSYEDEDKVNVYYTGATFSAPLLTREGHSLKGYADRPQKTSLISDFSAYTDDMDFFAVWEKAGGSGDGGGSGSDSGPGGSDSGDTSGGAVAVKKVASVAVTGGAGAFRYKASKKGNTMQLGVAVLPADAADRRVTWRTSNAKVATVNAAGLVTFKGKEGVVTITATAADGSGKYAARVIKVSKNVTKMRTPVKKVYIQRGKSLTLPVALDDKTAPKLTVASRLTWKSSKPKVLKVSAKGKIKAAKKVKKKTKVTVTATAYNGKKLKFTVYVVPKAKKLTSARVTWPKKARLKKGKTYQIKIKLRPATATGVKVTFKSSKKKVLTVDKAGKLVAKKKGKATVTVKVGRKTYKKKITVR